MANSVNAEGSRSLREAFDLPPHENARMTGKVLNITTLGLVKSDPRKGLHSTVEENAQMNTALKIIRYTAAVLFTTIALPFIAITTLVDGARRLADKYAVWYADRQILKVDSASAVAKMISLQKEGGKSDVETLKAARQFIQSRKSIDENNVAIEQKVLVALSKALIENYLWENFSDITLDKFSDYVNSLKGVSPHLIDLDVEQIRMNFIKRIDVSVHKDTLISKLKNDLCQFNNFDNFYSEFAQVLKNAREKLSKKEIDTLANNIELLKNLKESRDNVNRGRVEIDTPKLDSNIKDLEETILVSKNEKIMALEILTDEKQTIAAFVEEKREFIEQRRKEYRDACNELQRLDEIVRDTESLFDTFRSILQSVYDINKEANKAVIDSAEKMFPASDNTSESEIKLLAEAPESDTFRSTWQSAHRRAVEASIADAKLDTESVLVTQENLELMKELKKMAKIEILATRAEKQKEVRENRKLMDQLEKMAVIANIEDRALVSPSTQPSLIAKMESLSNRLIGYFYTSDAKANLLAFNELPFANK